MQAGFTYGRATSLDKIRYCIGRAELIGRIKSRITGRSERTEMAIRSGNLNVVDTSWLADTDCIVASISAVSEHVPIWSGIARKASSTRTNEGRGWKGQSKIPMLGAVEKDVPPSNLGFRHSHKTSMTRKAWFNLPTQTLLLCPEVDHVSNDGTNRALGSLRQARVEDLALLE